MFTGLVREVGRILGVRHASDVWSVDVEAARLAPALQVGDSVAVDGVCLTVTGRHDHHFRVDLSPETLRATTASGWRPGRLVHLEPSLRAADDIGGHFVLGHVDEVGQVERLRQIGSAAELTVKASARFLAMLVSKGSIAVNGVSLTLDSGPFTRGFTVTLIPQTLLETRLGRLRPGETVNLEADVLAKAAQGRPRASDTPPADRARGLTVEQILERGWTRR